MTDYDKMNCEQLEAVVADNERRLQLIQKIGEQEETLRIIARRVIRFPQDDKIDKCVSEFCRIRQIVADEWEISQRSMMSDKRPENISTPRQVAMFFCRRINDVKLEMVGEFFDKHHSTVMYACATVTNRMVEPKFRARIERIEAKLKIGEKSSQ